MERLQLTNLQLSQSESLLSRLLRDQRERRLGEGLRDQEQDGGRRRSCERLSWTCSCLSILWATDWEGKELFSTISSTATCVFLPHCRLRVQPSSRSFRFLIRILLQRNWLRGLEWHSLGLSEQDQGSVSEDGGRTVSFGTGMGWAGGILCGPTGEDIVLFTAFQRLGFCFSQLKGTRRTCCFFDVGTAPLVAYSSRLYTWYISDTSRVSIWKSPIYIFGWEWIKCLIISFLCLIIAPLTLSFVTVLLQQSLLLPLADFKLALVLWGSSSQTRIDLCLEVATCTKRAETFHSKCWRIPHSFLTCSLLNLSTETNCCRIIPIWSVIPLPILEIRNTV